MRELILNSGKIPVQRRTDYTIVKCYTDTESHGEASVSSDRLDEVEGDGEQIFGSYTQLTRAEQHRFKDKVACLKRTLHTTARQSTQITERKLASSVNSDLQKVRVRPS
jgi:hypothetical protein